MKKDSILEGLLASYKLYEAFVPKGNMYLEKGLIDKAICQRLGLDYETVKTQDFQQAVYNAMKELGL